MVWTVLEHKRIAKAVGKLPLKIVKKYELWKNLVLHQGPDILREFPGFHDESLKGDRKGQRSSRLSRRYRVIYSIDHEEIVVYVVEVTPHRY